MPTLSCTVKYSKNNEQVFSPAELIALYLYGVRVQDRSGTSLSRESYDFYIKAAQTEVERFLNIKLIPQVIEERMDFYQDEYRRFGYIGLTYPVVKPFRLVGFLGTIRQINFPSSWLSSRKTNDGFGYFRRIFIVPTQTADPLQMKGEVMLYSGVLPFTNMLGYASIPNYWNVEYVTGLPELPHDLVDIIGKLAAIQVLGIAGDIPYGVPGLSSMNLSIDGLSQQIATTASATHSLYSARIREYLESIKQSISRIKYAYKGITCTSI
jgi:hypothetical protein